MCYLSLVAKAATKTEKNLCCTETGTFAESFRETDFSLTTYEPPRGNFTEYLRTPDLRYG
ncbi:MAG: hypothetical protein IJ017_06585 [Oscillospiraceae bacterium]|nr:hypothetical protein [Oscillospiraceae bacterium]